MHIRKISPVRTLRVAGLTFLLMQAVFAQTPLVPPQPAGIAEGAGIIKSKQWALILGKSLFWDQQAGSDGVACAGCHFHAGADTRLRNQINPGFNDITVGYSPGGDIATGGDTTFGSQLSQTGAVPLGDMPSGAAAVPNYVLQPSDFPLHKLLDETDPNSIIISTTNDRISSQGAFNVIFDAVKSKKSSDVCGSPDAGIFHVGAYAARQVEPRNTPTTVNAAFNNRNFWDGRANNLFNGVGPFGLRDILGGPGVPADPNKRLVVADKKGNLSLTYVQLENASLASQAVAPVVSSVEMSCNGRTFADVGHKLLWNGNNARVALDTQHVDPTDSVLGVYAKTGSSSTGLKNTYTYDTLVQKAFDPKWWNASGKYRIVNGQIVKDKTGYTQMELNMPLFWGVSIMMYEATLVSNQSEFDGLLSAGHIFAPFIGNCGTDPTVDPLLARGCKIFFGIPGVPAAFTNPTPGVPSFGGGCAFCHGPADTFSEAAVQQGVPFPPFIEVTDINGNLDLRDLGFANIGIRPAFTDQMSGREDSYGNPLSLGRQYKNYVAHGNNLSYVLDPQLKNALTTGNLIAPPPVSFVSQFDGSVKLEVDGSSKIPSVRNVALTPPYFSWGGYSNLRQVMKLYNRGMSARFVGTSVFDPHGTGCITGDDSGSGPDGNTPFTSLVAGSDCNTNITGAITRLNLSDCDANGSPNGACLAQGNTVATDDLSAVIRFMKSLTDARVQCDAAPFDHPQLTVTNGHKTTDKTVAGEADDITFSFPAVGAAGYSHSNSYCIPNAGDLFAPGMQSRSGGAKATIP